jgi:predicted HicB family RNase H-like nuclease
MEKKTVKVTFRLPTADAEKLNLVAAYADVSVSSVVRHLLRHYLRDLHRFGILDKAKLS